MRQKAHVPISSDQGYRYRPREPLPSQDGVLSFPLVRPVGFCNPRIPPWQRSQAWISMWPMSLQSTRYSGARRTSIKKNGQREQYQSPKQESPSSQGWSPTESQNESKGWKRSTESNGWKQRNKLASTTAS